MVRKICGRLECGFGFCFDVLRDVRVLIRFGIGCICFLFKFDMFWFLELIFILKLWI